MMRIMRMMMMTVFVLVVKNPEILFSWHVFPTLKTLNITINVLSCCFWQQIVDCTFSFLVMYQCLLMIHIISYETFWLLFNLVCSWLHTSNWYYTTLFPLPYTVSKLLLFTLHRLTKFFWPAKLTIYQRWCENYFAAQDYTFI